MSAQPERSNTLEYRGAQYFGMERDPRISIKLGRRKVLTVVHRGSVPVIGYYSEEGPEPTGDYLYLDGDKARRLVEALAR